MTLMYLTYQRKRTLTPDCVFLTVSKWSSLPSSQMSLTSFVSSSIVHVVESPVHQEAAA